MALSSRLFQGDKKLEESQTNDAAHLTIGAKGEHVAKIQLALFALDCQRIERAEIHAQSYGRSTALAVLAYKTKRQIINRAYQDKPDDIVGKMTITRLDEEMLLWERTHKSRGECACAGRARASYAGLPGNLWAARPALSSARSVSNMRAGATRAESLPQLRKGLHIYCSITKKALFEDGFPLIAHIERAREALSGYGLTLSNEFGAMRGNGFADTINFYSSLVIDADIALLRKASEDTRQGSPSVLRVIVCPRSPNAAPGETFRNVTIGGIVFPPFVVLNSRAVSRDNAPLLHEMIHAAHDRRVEHDAEPYSVFFENSPTQAETVDRTWLKPDRAVQLSKGFFAA